MTYGLIGVSEWREINGGHQVQVYLAAMNEAMEVGWIRCRDSTASNVFDFVNDAGLDGQNLQKCI